MIRTRTALFAGLALMTAVAFFFLSQQPSEPEASPTSQPMAIEAAAGASRPSVPPPKKQVTHPSMSPQPSPGNAPSAIATPVVQSDRELAQRSVDRWVEGKNNSDPKAKAPVELATALVQQANDAVRDQKYGKGLATCERALAIDSGNQRAHMVCAIAACNLNAAKKAKRYIEGIASATRRTAVKQICIRNDVRW